MSAIPVIPDGLDALARFCVLTVRPLAALLLLPPLAGTSLPWRVRIGLAAALALFALNHAPHGLPLDGATLAGEALAGLVTGLGVAAAFAAATLAGEAAGQMLGLGFAAFAGPAGSPTALAGLYALLMWLALLGGAEGELFAQMAGGFRSVTPGALLGASAGEAVRLGGLVFGGGLRLALPLVSLLFLGNLLLAVVTRSAPQLGALAVGPVGLLLLMILALPLVFDDLAGRAADILARGLGG